MAKIILLVVIFLFVCWSLYNIEGFQNPPANPSGNPSGDISDNSSKCDLMIPLYKSLQGQYDKAVITNNINIVDTTLPGLNAIKLTLEELNCKV
jgi:hypothetical protein